MWLFSSRKTRQVKPARRVPPSYKPRLEAFEDRCLLSAGALDPTFGSGAGYVTTSLGKSSDIASAVLIQPWDGKIVTAGNTVSGNSTVMALTRYNADGTLDSTFGSGGKVISKIGTTWWNAAALYPHAGTANDGKIVEAGAGSLARFNANGSVDTSFGSRGLVTVGWIDVRSVVIQPDGKIVISGGGSKLSRYNANGTLDTGFGSGGTVTGPAFTAWGLGLQADGKQVAAGTTASNAGELARFNPNGTLDTTFNSTGAVPGTVTFSFAAGSGGPSHLAIYPSTGPDTADYGKIEVAGTVDGNPGGINSNQIALARFNADGSADNSFGQAGQVVTPFPQGGGMADATALQADGKIVVAGQTYQYPGTGHWAFSLLRYNTDGSLDTTFGNSGIVATPNATGDSRAWGVAIQPDGQIVAAGSTSGSTGWDFMVARYLPSEPQIGAFTANPNPVASGNSVTLAASNITDGNPSSTITQVAFYLDSNGNGQLEPGTDTLLGYGTLSGGTWTLTFSTAGWVSAIDTLFAQAEDSYGVFGDPFAITLTVQ